ncbi:hypothetical protein Lal_00023488 [Lupinus albus]|nr:hypothetical protein Lal_00023488 [Lupinus albus]
MIVSRLANHVIEARIMIAKIVGKILYIPRMSMSSSQTRQFSLIVSYDMPINKSQGQSSASVRLYIPKHVSSHGQLYVAFSRVQIIDKLKILIHDKKGKSYSITINVVSKEIFQNI